MYIILRKIALIFCTLFFYVLNAQNVNYKKTTDSLLKIYKKNKEFDSLASLAHDASIFYYKSRNYNNSITYALLEIETLNSNSINHPKLKKAIFNLGRFYYKNKGYYKSISAYKKVINDFEEDSKTFQAYCEIARNYSEIGDLYESIDYFEKGLNNPSNFNNKNLLGNYLNLAIEYNKLETEKSLTKELKILKKADSLSRLFIPSPSLINSLYNTYGNYYNNDLRFNFNKSKSYYTKLLNRAKKTNDTNTMLSAYINLSRLHNKTKRDSAYFYSLEGVNLAKENKGYLPKLYSNLADYYTNKGNYKEALIKIQDAIDINSNSTNKNSYLKAPLLEDVLLIKDKLLTVENLKDKATLLLKLHKETKNNNLLSSALDHINIVDILLDKIKAEIFETKSKLFWQREASEIYMLAVAICFENKDVDNAFYFIEKNKALLLLENIDDFSLKKQFKIPDSISQIEFTFKKQIYDLENLINNPKTISDSLKTSYYNLKIEYKNFVKNLKVKYPDYYNFKKPLAITSLSQVKKSLLKKSVIVEYILNDDDGYVIYLTENKTQLYKLKNITSLKNKIKTYINLVSKPINKTSELKKQNSLAKELAILLLPNFNTLNNTKEKQILIIPDYTLQNLPFESLKINDKYIIEGFEISYAYSLSFLEKNKKANRNAEGELLAFAPRTFNYNSLQNLPRSIAEVNNIKSKLNGVAFIDSEATKTNFFNKINDFKIIHLATHANASDSISPWIAFKNEKLYLNELYTIKTQAELVVLNACNTSLGEINSGEGVFSLARGFFYSGANSVVSSLWNVNDKSNAEITTSFYSYLKEGKTKSASLRKAKLDYIKTHTLSEASPYYWSSLILIGDDSAIKLQSNLLYYLLLGILLLILFFILKKIKIVGNKS